MNTSLADRDAAHHLAKMQDLADFYRDLAKAMKHARALSDDFLAARGLTLDVVKRYRTRKREALQVEYKNWLAARQKPER